MNIALIVLLLALLLGGVGLFVEALRWVLIIALVLLLISALTGWRSRGRV
jgi:ABC-type multidrug transport system permease subunit